MSTKEKLPANNTCEASSPIYHSLSARARVVKWQTRTFEGRMPQGMGVQVPPRAFLFPALPVPLPLRSLRSVIKVIGERRLKLHVPAPARLPSHLSRRSFSEGG
jgi:hypothetical protein